VWIAHSNIAKVLVWLAAALMPADILLAGTCGCGELNTTHGQGKLVKTLAPAACCCHSSTVCQCCHRAQNNPQSVCCKNRTQQPVSSRGAISPLCVCFGSRAPAPQIPLPDSSAAKQLTGQTFACLVPAAVVELSSPKLSDIGACPSSPASPLERLSNLCRFLI
jgi:hypothetical protein